MVCYYEKTFNLIDYYVVNIAKKSHAYATFLSFKRRYFSMTCNLCSKTSVISSSNSIEIFNLKNVLQTSKASRKYIYFII